MNGKSVDFDELRELVTEFEADTKPDVVDVDIMDDEVDELKLTSVFCLPTAIMQSLLEYWLLDAFRLLTYFGGV